jgi:hypothetical protein
MTRKWRQVRFAADNPRVAATLARRLVNFRIDDLSDQHGQVYGTDRFAVSSGHNGQRCNVLAIEGELPEEFADLDLYRPPKQKSKAKH